MSHKVAKHVGAWHQLCLKQLFSSFKEEKKENYQVNLGFNLIGVYYNRCP